MELQAQQRVKCVRCQKWRQVRAGVAQFDCWCLDAVSDKARGKAQNDSGRPLEEKASRGEVLGIL
jgi:hypothetical protein